MSNSTNNSNEIRNSGEQYVKGAAEEVKETAKTAKDKALELKDKAVDSITKNPWQYFAAGVAVAAVAGYFIKSCKCSKE